MQNEHLYIMFIMAGLSLFPIFFILTTSFIKIAVVCTMTRDSLGLQQVPPNMVIYGLSLILSFYIMGPVYTKTYNSLSQQFAVPNQVTTPQEVLDSLQESSKPIKEFLFKHSTQSERTFFLQNVGHFWNGTTAVTVSSTDFIILVPAFVVTELTAAFKIGFLIYLPSVILDILVSNILMAMGMMMMSPTTISLPIKLLLFISVNGWSRLIHALLNTY